LNPKWDETFEFLINDLASQTLTLFVADLDDISGSLIPLGECQVPLRVHVDYHNQRVSENERKQLRKGDPKSPLSPREEDEETFDMNDDEKYQDDITEDIWVPLSSVPRGTIHIQISWNPFQAVRKVDSEKPPTQEAVISLVSTSTDIKDPIINKTPLRKDNEIDGKKISAPMSPLKDESAMSEFFKKKGRAKTSVGCLIVLVHKALHLPATDLNGKSDPFVELKCGNSPMKKTLVKHATLEPIWEEQFEFPVMDPKNDYLELRLKDKDSLSDDLVATAKIPLPAPGTKLQDQAFELELEKNIKKKDVHKPIIRLTLSLKSI